MQFIKTDDWQEGTAALLKRLQKELSQNEHVLWLVCGGSNITSSAKVMAQLTDEETKNLAIFMTDERYGEVDHIDSNAKQLRDAGFEPKQAIFVPMLVPGFTLAETQERYGLAVKQALEHADITIAQFGIGPDGHIAGILPDSPASKSTDWVNAYEAPHYTRVTLTFPALRNIDVAFAMAFGDNKKPALERLRDEAVDLIEQPSQILKELPEAFVYNDQIGAK